MSDPWRWIGLDVVLAIHERQLAEHGGPDGIRDENALMSALTPAEHRATYLGGDAADLAAAYAWGILRNHPFVDGNKRTAWVLARVFLADHGHTLRFDPADAIRTIEAAAGEALDEASLAQWFRERLALVG